MNPVHVDYAQMYKRPCSPAVLNNPSSGHDLVAAPAAEEKAATTTTIPPGSPRSDPSPQATRSQASEVAAAAKPSTIHNTDRCTLSSALLLQLCSPAEGTRRLIRRSNGESLVDPDFDGLRKGVER